MLVFKSYKFNKIVIQEVHTTSVSSFRISLGDDDRILLVKNKKRFRLGKQTNPLKICFPLGPNEFVQTVLCLGFNYSLGARD